MPDRQSIALPGNSITASVNFDSGGHLHKIMNRQRLVDRRQPMVAIRPQRANGESKIDLRARSNPCGHYACVLQAARLRRAGTGSSGAVSFS